MRQAVNGVRFGRRESVFVWRRRIARRRRPGLNSGRESRATHDGPTLQISVYWPALDCL